MRYYISVSAIHGLGLFTNETIAKDEDVIVAFTKIADTISNDYIESAFGKFINHSLLPNTAVIETNEFIILRANIEIKKGTEITANYNDVLKAMKNTKEMVDKIKFW